MSHIVVLRDLFALFARSVCGGGVGVYLNCKSVKEARGKREDSGLEEGGRNVYYTFSNYMLLPLGLAHIERLLFFLLSFSLGLCLLLLLMMMIDLYKYLSERDAEDPEFLSLSQTQIHISLRLPENAFIIILPAATGSSQYSTVVLLLLLIRYCRSVRHEMLTSITYGYEKGSTSGNEIFRSLFCPCPCPLSCSFFLSLFY